MVCDTLLIQGGKMHDELLEMKNKLEDHESRLSRLECLLKGNADGFRKEKPLSLGEFLSKKSPKTDIQKTLVIGYYLENIENVTPFNKKDLEIAFRRAKEPPPKNINLCVYGNIKHTFMMEYEEKKDNRKAWCLTRTGIGFVEKKLKKE